MIERIERYIWRLRALLYMGMSGLLYREGARLTEKFKRIEKKYRYK